ncbi:MAG: ATP-dependent helicase, partial [Chloroflexi bacterium]|nr:ATP-dependent helicase [Chloroflexota bacterium]
RRWHGAVVLPIDQLILILGQDLFQNSADLAIVHKIAVELRRKADANPTWRLPEYAEELKAIATNQRRFLGMDNEARGFDPNEHRGKVTITTMHSAKGLEWDRVYLMSVNTYDFPSALPGDQYMSEKWYIRGQLNLEAETLAQLKTAADALAFDYAEGEATADARLEYTAERLRLLYVGITRARKELIVTWNTGRRGDQQPAIPFVALRTYFEEYSRDAAR